MDHIGTVLPTVLRKRGLQKQAVCALIVYRAQAWIWEQLPQHAKELRALHVRHGVLVLESDHSIASQECQQLSAVLLAYLRDSCEGMPLDSLRIIRRRA